MSGGGGSGGPGAAGGASGVGACGGRTDDIGVLLAPVAACAARGLDQDLARAAVDAVAAGCPTRALREALLMVSLFAGFPRTLDALAAALPALKIGAAEPVSEPDLPDDEAARRELFRTRGGALFRRVYGASSERVFTQLLQFDPELPHWVLEDAYGKVLARPGLSPAHRERLAVVFLVALELPNQLVGHVRGALNCGATPAQIRASLAAVRDFVPAAMVTRVDQELAAAEG